MSGSFPLLSLCDIYFIPDIIHFSNFTLMHCVRIILSLVLFVWWCIEVEVTGTAPPWYIWCVPTIAVSFLVNFCATVYFYVSTRVQSVAVRKEDNAFEMRAQIQLQSSISLNSVATMSPRSMRDQTSSNVKIL